MLRNEVMNAAFAVALAAAAPASASEALAQKKNCLNCHQVERKVVGPAFKDVAQRYAGQKDAAPKLAEKIRIGGAGAWGPVPMSANPQVTPDEARRLAEWVLTLK
jgi:cytochrome c